MSAKVRTTASFVIVQPRLKLEEVQGMTYQFSFCVSGAILISFFSFSILKSAPHPLIRSGLDAIGEQLT
jgi:hypothetical protein